MSLIEKKNDVTKVLFFVDQPRLTILIKRLFSAIKEDVVVFQASSEKEALEITSKENPDIILVDICLSGVGGEVVSRELKALAPKSEIILLTRYQCDDFPIGI